MCDFFLPAAPVTETCWSGIVSTYYLDVPYPSFCVKSRNFPLPCGDWTFVKANYVRGGNGKAA